MSNKLDFKIKSWGDCTISQYAKIEAIINDEEYCGTEKDIALLAILCDVPEEKIWNMEMKDVNQMRLDTFWIKEFNYPKKIKFKKIKIADYECVVDVRLENMTLSQYVDYQTYIKDIEKYRAELLSVFFIPKGHKYNDGYDLADLVQKIRDNVSIVVFNCVCFFFLKKYQSLTRDSLYKVRGLLKVRSWIMRKGPMKTKVKELISLMNPNNPTLRYIIG